eukprot:6209623-Pleurochrysis_carterae.AAC.1
MPCTRIHARAHAYTPVHTHIRDDSGERVTPRSRSPGRGWRQLADERATIILRGGAGTTFSESKGR